MRTTDTSSHTPRSASRPAGAALIAACMAILAAPPAAGAAESAVPTAQQRSYGAAWLPFVDPAELPPVAERPVVCLVDSGVAISEDLPADRPQGPIIARRSVVTGEDGLPGIAHENQHGTAMAQMIGAEQDGTGTVGAFPWARIVSIKAMGANERSLSVPAYVNGIRECRQEVEAPIASVSLSFGCGCGGSDDEVARLRAEIAFARQRGALVIASAGNVPSQPISYPAGERGVIAVAAGDRQGALCDYGSYDSQALVGPGCAVDSVNDGGQPVTTTSGGSSSAAAFTSALVAAVKTFAPEATTAELETWLRQGARFVDDRPVVDAEGLFRAAGLGGIVDRAKARQALISPPDGTVIGGSPASPAMTPQANATHLVRFKAKASWKRGRVSLTVTGRPRGARVELAVEHRKGRRPAVYSRLRTVTRTGSTISARARKRPDRLRVRLLLTDGRRARPIYLRVTRGGAYR